MGMAPASGTGRTSSTSPSTARRNVLRAVDGLIGAGRVSPSPCRRAREIRPKHRVASVMRVPLQPLEGYTVGVTADRRASEQAELLRRRGARVLDGPTIATAYLASV